MVDHRQTNPTTTSDGSDGGSGGFGNALLDSLPPADQGRLAGKLQREHGRIKRVLYAKGGRLDTVYFPVDSVVSVLTAMKDNAGVEIATIGNEGMVGSAVVLGSSTMPAREYAQVQVPGALLRLDTAAFTSEIARDGPFRALALRYTQALFSQISQQVACNGLHSVEERCSRWLLLTHDRVGVDEFPMTQEFLSQMLAVRRASVTLAAGALQHAGFIHYRHGRITIVDRDGLEASSCECYQVIREEFDRLLGEDRSP